MSMKIITDENKIEDILRRGTENCEKNLLRKIGSGKQLNIKLGIDPTEIHRRATILMKLRTFRN